jgi:two-component system, LuxR family, sensor kinase FixL
MNDHWAVGDHRKMLPSTVDRVRGEFRNKLMNLEAMVASIAHEVRQPLAAIATNGMAALRFLGHAQPDLEETRSALDRIIIASHRAGEVFDNISALFGSADQRHEPVDVNEMS